MGNPLVFSSIFKDLIVFMNFINCVYIFILENVISLWKANSIASSV